MPVGLLCTLEHTLSFEVPVVIQAQVLDLADYVVSVQGGFDQLAKGLLKCFVGAGIVVELPNKNSSDIYANTHKNGKVLH